MAGEEVLRIAASVWRTPLGWTDCLTAGRAQLHLCLAPRHQPLQGSESFQMPL